MEEDSGTGRKIAIVLGVLLFFSVVGVFIYLATRSTSSDDSSSSTTSGPSSPGGSSSNNSNSPSSPGTSTAPPNKWIAYTDDDWPGSQNNEAQATFCTGKGGKFTQGSNTAYPGCGGGWCCMDTSKYTPAMKWMKYVESDWPSSGSTKDQAKFCAGKGGFFTNGENGRFPGCSDGYCCVPSIRQGANYRKYDASDWPGSGGYTDAYQAKFCAKKGGAYTAGTNDKFPQCTDGWCCVSPV